MKKFKKVMFWTFIGLVLLLDIVLTIYLLNYNEYNVSVMGDKTFLVMTNKLDKYKKGDLLVVKKNPNSEYKVGDHVFFYEKNKDGSVVNYGKINELSKGQDGINSFIMSNEYILGDKSIIGKGETAVVYAGVGTVLGFLTSKWVFLIIVIVPILILFIYELYLLIVELNKAKK